MADSPNKRLLYIALIGAALLPLVIGMSEYGALFSLVALLFVILYIRSDRKKEEAKPGFPVIPKDPPGVDEPTDESG